MERNIKINLSLKFHLQVPILKCCNRNENRMCKTGKKNWRKITGWLRLRSWPTCKRKILHTSDVAHQARAYPSFCSMKQKGVFQLLPEWNASPLQGNPQHLFLQYPFLHLGGERHCESKALPKDTKQCPQPGLKPRPLDPETCSTNHQATVSPTLHVVQLK